LLRNIVCSFLLCFISWSDVQCWSRYLVSLIGLLQCYKNRLSKQTQQANAAWIWILLRLSITLLVCSSRKEKIWITKVILILHNKGRIYYSKESGVMSFIIVSESFIKASVFKLFQSTMYFFFFGLFCFYIPAVA
jgi:uncharacterized membrane protein SirB2